MAETTPETIFVRTEGGAVLEMDLPLHEAIAQRMERGHIVRVNRDGSPYTGGAAAVTDPAAEVPPVSSASKSAWVGYAVRAKGMDPDEAEAMTKGDLVERFGGGA